ncbi:MAG: hypothetical protein MOGMAGMI_02171 [Candidatus Omnitrophica bacterium]|nr:hypothetical protein [Candidatus Omnitrophota bacterium]
METQILIYLLSAVIVVESAVLVALPLLWKDRQKRQLETLREEVRRLEQDLLAANERADRVERELQKELQRISTLISRVL